MRVEITRDPTAGWLSHQVADGFPRDTAPRLLRRDRDESYGPYFRKRIAAMGITEVVTTPRSPGRTLTSSGPSENSSREERCLTDRHALRALRRRLGFGHHIGLTRRRREIVASCDWFSLRYLAGLVVNGSITNVLPPSLVRSSDPGVKRVRRHRKWGPDRYKPATARPHSAIGSPRRRFPTRGRISRAPPTRRFRLGAGRKGKADWKDFHAAREVVRYSSGRL